MSFESLSGKKLALIFVGAGVLAVFAISGFQARSLFAPSTTEEATVTIKEGDNCIVEGSDRVPRKIADCQYDVGDTVTITYKAQQPSIESHQLKVKADNNG